MSSRIDTRPGVTVPALGFITLGVAFLAVVTIANAARGEYGQAIAFGVMTLLGGVLFVVPRRAFSILVSSEGVSLWPDSLSRYFRSKWLPWSEVVGFELKGRRSSETPVGSQIVARTVRGDTAVVCQIPTWLLDSPRWFGQAVERMLRVLEEARHTRLRDSGQSCGGTA